MDVDSDALIDQNLLVQFNCMGTTDREELVKQFRDLIGNKVDENTSSFFLEMNNWNLQAAICSFLDYDNPYKVPTMSLQETKRFGDVNMPPNKKFVIRWIIQNTSDTYWPRGCSLRHIGGNYAVQRTSIPVKMVAPYSTTTVYVESITPPESGSYNSQWQLITPCGVFFGEVLWILFCVDTSLSENTDSELSEELSTRMTLNDEDVTVDKMISASNNESEEDCVIVED